LLLFGKEECQIYIYLEEEEREKEREAIYRKMFLLHIRYYSFNFEMMSNIYTIPRERVTGREKTQTKKKNTETKTRRDTTIDYF